MCSSVPCCFVMLHTVPCRVSHIVCYVACRVSTGNGADTAVVQVKALSEELENPMNVHRWRKLEGSDPGTYEMVQKIQTLQKRLISKTEEAPPLHRTAPSQHYGCGYAARMRRACPRSPRAAWPAQYPTVPYHMA